MTLSHPTPVLVPVPSIPPGTAARAVAAVPGQKRVGTHLFATRKREQRRWLRRGDKRINDNDQYLNQVITYTGIVV